MPNVASIIKSHNTKVLTPPAVPKKPCNCQNPGPNSQNCPMKGKEKCVTGSVIYKATITAPNTPTMQYIGLAGETFKKRYYGHVDSIKPKHTDLDKARTDTELSKHIWHLRDQHRRSPDNPLWNQDDDGEYGTWRNPLP